MRIYVDNAATTKMSKKAIEAMLPYMDSVYGNPSSLHSVGQEAAEALVNARRTIASSSMATELIKGKPVSEALKLTNKAVAEALDGLPAHKLHCSVLAEEAIKKALRDYYDKRGMEYDHSLFPDRESCGHCSEG